MEVSKIETFKSLFSEYCNEQIHRGYCNSSLCDVCSIGKAYNTMFQTSLNYDAYDFNEEEQKAIHVLINNMDIDYHDISYSMQEFVNDYDVTANCSPDGKQFVSVIYDGLVCVVWFDNMTYKDYCIDLEDTEPILGF